MQSKSKVPNYINQASQSANLLKIRLLVLGSFAVSVIVFATMSSAYVSATRLDSSSYLYKDATSFTTSNGVVQGVSTEASGPARASFQVYGIDYRAHVLNEYFRVNNSPLYGTGQIFVDACDKYGAPADCTTVAAIAHAETDLCKYYNSASYYNCWGFGGGGENRIYFNNWNESIDLVTDRLVNSYGIRYMIDPSLMERTFCGWEPGCTNWGNRVKYYMQAISDFPTKIGLPRQLISFR